MNISETFIRRPIATSLLMMGILIFGAASYPLLPVSSLPTLPCAMRRWTASVRCFSP